uniref:Uncharacterized protein n=1 Tax=Sphaerodactylus townsendi TaxID=933632 RepID=A0ACB8EJY3_9SAUR
MEAIAKYDFKATADDELSFKRGDVLKPALKAIKYVFCPVFSERLFRNLGAVTDTALLMAKVMLTSTVRMQSKAPKALGDKYEDRKSLRDVDSSKGGSITLKGARKRICN